MGALCRDKVMAPPILIGALLLPTLLFSPLSPGICLFLSLYSSLPFCFLLLRSIFFPTWPHKRLSKRDILLYYSTSDLHTLRCHLCSSLQGDRASTHIPSGYNPRFPSSFPSVSFFMFPCSKADPNQLNIPETRPPRRWHLSSPLLRSSLPWAPQTVPLYLSRKVSCGGCVLPRSRRVAMYSSGHSDGYYSTRTTTVVHTPHGAYRYSTVWSVSKTKVHLKVETNPTRTLWGDLCLDAVACDSSRFIRPWGVRISNLAHPSVHTVLFVNQHLVGWHPMYYHVPPIFAKL